MTLSDRLTLSYMRTLIETPEGRAFLLNQIADAEDNGEAQIFDQILKTIDDPKLQKIVDRHRTDEIRHGELFRACRDRTGVDPGPVPDDIKVLDRINARVGGFFDRPIRSAEDVVEAYLILQVIEERATQQFTIFEQAFRAVDPATADVVQEIAADEARHLMYCRAVVKQYAKDEAYVEKRLAELREHEAVAFRETSSANMRHALARGFIRGPVERMFWRCLNWIGDAFEAKPMTSFATAAA